MVHLRGAYLSTPRWATNLRRGRLEMHISRILTRDELRSLPGTRSTAGSTTPSSLTKDHGRTPPAFHLSDAIARNTSSGPSTSAPIAVAGELSVPGNAPPIASPAAGRRGWERQASSTVGPATLLPRCSQRSFARPTGREPRTTNSVDQSAPAVLRTTSQAPPVPPPPGALPHRVSEPAADEPRGCGSHPRSGSAAPLSGTDCTNCGDQRHQRPVRDTARVLRGRDASRPPDGSSRGLGLPHRDNRSRPPGTLQ
jgi:hypothetical protein